ncbi:MAG: alanine--tRNA ligase [Planctomycetota bacterium]
MQALSAREIRERYLRFFEARGHARLPSDSLVPANDPTLLFTGAGMNQFKDMFLGRGSLPHKRATTAQKCLRVPDLENVGATPRHHTFFEMLGNFSFGDYFKSECVAWEWEFFTEELGIPKDQLVVTIYKDDEEAFDIWTKDIGVAPERVFRFGEKENFWPAEAPSKGPNGPCGPCSEIYFDASPGEALPKDDGLEELPDDRFTEIGNCVFTQFERKDGGVLDPLPQKNIDVGLGLERIAAVLIGAPNNFGTDLFQPYIEKLGSLSGKRYGEDATDDVRMRRIADHVRAVAFCISDGALPGNEGRGYVVRKILRRAVRDALELGLETSCLHELVDTVGEVMGEAYPEVREHAGQCRSLIKTEEESFRRVYRQGAERLAQWLAKQDLPEATTRVADAEYPVLEGSGDFAFELHDTYGFPIDITRATLRDHGVEVDEPGFEAAMQAQRDRARAASTTSEEVFSESVGMRLRDLEIPTTSFVGYDRLTGESVLRAILVDGRPVDSAAAGAKVQLVVDETPFYAQGGGQVGDRGVADGPEGRAEIRETASQDGFWLHEAEVQKGALTVGQSVCLAVDKSARRATERNHTATHLLHAALKEVLGEHVSQAGSEVGPERLRFDFTHGERLNEEQLAAVEGRVNGIVLDAIGVQPAIRSLEDARAAGFVAMFGEKYGDEVRTLSVGEFSRELCGGTHVSNSGNIGQFRIVADQAVAAGTRRIEAVTGLGALRLARETGSALGAMAQQLKVPALEVPTKVDALVGDLKKLRKELEKAQAADLDAVLRDLEGALDRSGDVNRALLVTKGLQMKEVQELLTRARQKFSPFAGIVLVESAEGVLVAAAIDKALTDRLKAGDVVKQLTQVLGGGGGGRPEMAQGKGKNASALPEAKSAGEALLAAL